MRNQRFPFRVVWAFAACGAIAVGSAGCGGKEEPATTQAPAALLTHPGAKPEPATPEPAPGAQSPAPSPVSPAPISALPAPTAAAQPEPAPSPGAPPPSGGSGVSDPGGEIAVTATKSGLSRVGAQKCKMCHRVQYVSWAESGHAKRKPALECENCHGAGSEYGAMAVMKNAAKATAAGLVKPDAAFCKTCHQQGWSDERLEKAHAHKAG